MRTALTLLLTVLALTAGVVAQDPLPGELPDRFAGSAPDPLPKNTALTIQFSDSSKANQTVTVEVHDTVDPTKKSSVAITLNGDGNGSAEFTPPGDWWGVVLTHSSSQDHTIPII